MIPTSTNVSVRAAARLPSALDGIVTFAVEGAKEVEGTRLLSEQDRRAAERLLGAGVARGKPREIRFDLIDIGEGKVRQVLIAGLGPVEKITVETIREAAGAAARAIRKNRLKSVAVIPPAVGQIKPEDSAEAVVTGMLLASFAYEEFKGVVSQKKEKDDKPGHLDLTVIAKGYAAKAVERARIIADAQNYARTIAFRPGNVINPPALAKVASEMAREVGLDCRVLDEKQMQKLGMGGILAVGAGSALTPPRMIVLQHRPGGIQASRARAQAGEKLPVLLVIGKAITFDTGGISIKPAEKMGEMVFDKCGGMAVLGLMLALARLKAPVHVVGILSSAENHISANAYRPGDILRMYNGVTVEVTNTDAEGRLVLSDALAWGIETHKPRAVVDLATLTGGVIVALGTSQAGIMCNDERLFEKLKHAAQRSGEKIWRLPISDDVREQIKSTTADIVNSAGRQASPLQGSEFLRHFVPEGTPWAHIDIAGVADTDKDLPYYGKGATGWGVRTLVEWVMAR